MAVDLPGDLIMNVARAADPVRLAEASERLRAAANARSADTSFVAFDAGRSSLSRANAQSDTAQDSLMKFESVVLQTFVQSLLPKDAESAYGGGFSGEMWQSLLAEKIAEQIAERGGIGIADSVMKRFFNTGDGIEPVAGLRDPDTAVVSARGADMATRIAQEAELRAFGISDAKNTGEPT